MAKFDKIYKYYNYQKLNSKGTIPGTVTGLVATKAGLVSPLSSVNGRSRDWIRSHILQLPVSVRNRCRSPPNGFSFKSREAVEPNGCALPLWALTQGCIQTRRVWRHGPAQQLGVAVVFQQFDLLPVSRFLVFTIEPIPKSKLLFALEPLPKRVGVFAPKQSSTSEFVFVTIPKSNCFGSHFAMFARAGSQFGLSLALVFAPKQFQRQNSSL